MQLWMIWTKGFGFRHWWHGTKNYRIPIFVVDHLLPARIVLWAFICIHANAGSHGEDYRRCYDNWVNEHPHLRW